MKLLVCASARVEIVEKCLREIPPENQVFVAATTGSAERLTQVLKNDGVCICLNGAGFCREDYALLREYGPFDVVVILSGWREFGGFSNVVSAVYGLSFSYLVFYNAVGHKEIIPMRHGIGRVLKQYSALFLFRFFQIIRPFELLVERIVIRCAELLGL